MNPNGEWIECDSLGGFAMGRADAVRTRRYHSLLTVATTPPTGRFTLVNGVEAWLELSDRRVALSSHRYAPDVTYPDGAERIVEFSSSPWPRWRYRVADDLEVEHELIVLHGSPLVALSWRLVTPSNARLTVRPLISGRDMHALHHENAAFNFEAAIDGERVEWNPYEGVPDVVALSNGTYEMDAQWYRAFEYEDERERGLDFVEDLASPGSFTFDLATGRAIILFGSGSLEHSMANAFETEWNRPSGRGASGLTARCWDAVERSERERRARFSSPLHRAADTFIVRRGSGRTIVAGYPWFSDWGRDTLIALRGLCLAGERLKDARDILVEWSRHVNEGMLPNFFPDGRSQPEYNSVDASLWFVIAADEFLARAANTRLVDPSVGRALHLATDAIVEGYAKGTRFGIRADDSGLLNAGERGVQLTWMDAKVDDWVVTPRIGKPVEIQALWINTLHIAGARSPRWRAMAYAATASFHQRFWNRERGLLYDVVDVDHVPGSVDPSFRPNQLFTIGGLPHALVEGERARSIVDAAERELWTAAGPRSLSPLDPSYVGRYQGDRRSRDGAYHQGTVWPWLAGAFIEAWVRVHGSDDDARHAARRRFYEPLVAHYGAASSGQIAEIADGDAPNASKGAPFQAWSVGEAMRLDRDVLAMRPLSESSARRSPAP